MPSGQRADRWKLGFHRKYLLCIVDECCGVPAELWEAAEPLASNAAGIGFASGNRTDPASHFAEVCKSGSGWEVKQMSAYPNPAYTGEKVPDDRRARSAPCGALPRRHTGPDARWRRSQRMTATLQRACCATLWLTEPSSQSLMPPVPRAPTTTMSAPRDCSISASAVSPGTASCST